MNALTTVAAWIGDTAGRIAIRVYAARELVLAGLHAWGAAEPEHPVTWEKPVPRFDTRKVWLIADKASVDRALAEIIRANAPTASEGQR